MRRGELDLYEANGGHPPPPMGSPIETLSAQVLRVTAVVDTLTTRVEALQRPGQRLLAALVAVASAGVGILAYLAWVAHDILLRMAAP